MPYLLRGGPRDRQLVDDLPRGYRAAAAGLPPDEDLVSGIPVDAAVWDGEPSPDGVIDHRRHA